MAVEHARIVVDANGADADTGSSLLRREAGRRRPQACEYRSSVFLQ